MGSLTAAALVTVVLSISAAVVVPTVRGELLRQPASGEDGRWMQRPDWQQQQQRDRRALLSAGDRHRQQVRKDDALMRTYFCELKEREAKWGVKSRLKLKH